MPTIKNLKDEKDKKANHAFKMLVLGILVAQNTAMVLFMRATLTVTTKVYLPSTTVVLSELVKLTVCIGMLAREEQQTLGYWSAEATMRSFHRGILDKPYDTLKMLVPAALYVSAAGRGGGGWGGRERRRNEGGEGNDEREEREMVFQKRTRRERLRGGRAARDDG